jgi:hypothetical protein
MVSNANNSRSECFHTKFYVLLAFGKLIAHIFDAFFGVKALQIFDWFGME